MTCNLCQSAAMETTNTTGHSDFLSYLQSTAIHTTDCPLLIIAGRGSGKTFTLVERAYYLIAEKKVPPESLLISTLAEKTASEIIDFKSEAKPDLADTPSYQRYQKQLETYAHIVEERHGLNVSQMHLYYTGESNGSPLITFEKNQRHIDQTMQEFDVIIQRIESLDFRILQRPRRVCRGCDLRYYCSKIE